MEDSAWHAPALLGEIAPGFVCVWQGQCPRRIRGQGTSSRMTTISEGVGGKENFEFRRPTRHLNRGQQQTKRSSSALALVLSG
jgi:hypothetical protein